MESLRKREREMITRFDGTTKVADVSLGKDDIPAQRTYHSPYVEIVDTYKNNTNMFSITAPAPKAGYKFLCWQSVCATQGDVCVWKVEYPQSETSNVFYQNIPGFNPVPQHVQAMAIYVDNGEAS